MLNKDSAEKGFLL